VVNSIDKGKRFERMVAKILENKLGCKFHRVANSGGLTTALAIKNRIFHGDLFTEDERYKDIVFECKFRAEPLQFSELFHRANAKNLNGFLCFNPTLGSISTPLTAPADRENAPFQSYIRFDFNRLYL
jgi:hypothetical protein